jgi:hypothetical protein
MQAYTINLLSQMQGFKKEAEQLLGYEKLFQFPETELTELEDTLFEVEMKETLWRTLGTFAEQCQTWSTESFFEVRRCHSVMTLQSRCSACHGKRLACCQAIHMRGAA